MKKIIIASLLCTAIVPGFAAVKCIPNLSDDMCLGTAKTGTADWSIACRNSEAIKRIKGVAFCSDQTGTTASSLTVSSSGNNINCWCKMTVPAVSQWVFASSGYMGTDHCLYECASYCTSNFQQLKTTMLSSTLE